MTAALRAGLRGSTWLVLAAAGALAVAALAADPVRAHLCAAAAATLLAAAVGLVWPRRVLYGLLAWLVVLGLLRRLLALSVPGPEHDPLLLVEPAALALVLATAGERLRALPRSALATATAVLAGVVALSAVNPAQGGPVVGLAGLLFLLVPLAGFWVGRALCDDRTFGRLLTVAALLAVPVALYGLGQTAFGFPRWDMAWIEHSEQAYQALNVGIALRAFSTFPSFAEYAYFLAIGLAVWLAFAFRSLRIVVAGPVIALLGVALVLASVRLVLLLLVTALVAMGLVRLRVPATVAVVAVVVALLGVSAVAGRLAPSAGATDANQALLQHQARGLADPLDPRSSTLLTHLTLISDGITSAATHPLGSGAGTVSLAATKFGGAAHATEADPSNMAVAAGIPGLAAYAVVAALVLTRAYRLAVTRRDPLSLIALAVVVITFLQWLNGGQYGVALLVWITIGWIDRNTAGARRR